MILLLLCRFNVVFCKSIGYEYVAVCFAVSCLRFCRLLGQRQVEEQLVLTLTTKRTLHLYLRTESSILAKFFYPGSFNVPDRFCYV